MKKQTLHTLGFLLIWLVLLGAVAAAIFSLRAGILALCLYSFLMLLVLARLMTFLWLQPLQCERDVSDDVIHIGDSVKVVVKIKNTSPWPILWVYAEETLPPKMPGEGMTKRLLFLPPRRSFHLYYRLTLTRRGCYQLGPLVLESGDVFGLFRRYRVHPRRDFVTALPNYELIEEYQLGQRRRLGDFTASRSIFEDPNRLRGVREYRRGDALKRIHWKLSARTGELRSKLYDRVVEAGATVVLDFHQDTWAAAHAPKEVLPPPETAVEIACSICRYLSDGGWKVGLFSNGRDPLGMPGITMAQARATDSYQQALQAARRGRRDERLAPISIRARSSPEQFLTIQENLGRIELSDGLPLESLLWNELPYIEREQVLVIITGFVTDSFISAILRIRELGYRIMVFMVSNIPAHDRAFAAFVPHGIEVFSMDAHWRLTEIATGRRTF